MNPTAPPPTASHLAPESPPLHPPSVYHNTRILSSLGTLAACFSGLISGILGLTNLTGFSLYLITSLITALTLASIKCAFDIERYVPEAHSFGTSSASTRSAKNGGEGKAMLRSWKGWIALSGIGQENLLGFLLFWIGSYALIHVYD
ncbi:hypothetical protein IAR55_004887 [Kwoniella newhampshirensis]|uniref:ER membrane protein complex subunit 6 n=1 Tax=Kwoniella newhampshirensis TaxID=1651941 RepID=A0AAW0YI94_9TREE